MSQTANPPSVAADSFPRLSLSVREGSDRGALHVREPVVFNIISPDRFKQIPWKNGQGVTSELAISEGDDIAEFTWRISIAKVDKDGAFSDFSGFRRTLVLLEGRGLELRHDDTSFDRLQRPLDYAEFDGASRTVGTLISGPITDFNVMSRAGRMSAEVASTRGLLALLKIAVVDFVRAL